MYLEKALQLFFFEFTLRKKSTQGVPAVKITQIYMPLHLFSTTIERLDTADAFTIVSSCSHLKLNSIIHFENGLFSL